ALFLGSARTYADIIVVDTTTPDVRRYTAPNTLAFTATTNLNNPTGLVVDGGGNVFVVNNGNTGANSNSVAEFTPTLAANGFFVPSGATLNTPYSIAFDSAGNAYVTNVGFSGSNPPGSQGSIQQLSSAGAPLATFGLASSHAPTGIAFSTVLNAMNPGYN